MPLIIGVLLIMGAVAHIHESGAADWMDVAWLVAGTMGILTIPTLMLIDHRERMRRMRYWDDARRTRSDGVGAGQ